MVMIYVTLKPESTSNIYCISYIHGVEKKLLKFVTFITILLSSTMPGLRQQDFSGIKQGGGHNHNSLIRS